MLQVCQCEMLKLNSPTSIKLTDKIFHAVARTAFGIPDQLSFRNSSTNISKRTYVNACRNWNTVNLEQLVP